MRAAAQRLLDLRLEQQVRCFQLRLDFRRGQRLLPLVQTCRSSQAAARGSSLRARVPYTFLSLALEVVVQAAIEETRLPMADIQATAADTFRNGLSPLPFLGP
jgi:hypothetical protein